MTSTSSLYGGPLFWRYASLLCQELGGGHPSPRGACLCCSDDGSERQLAGHQFAAHSAGLEEMEARARVLGGMGSPAVAQRALGAGPLVGPRGGGWTVREVVATESNVSSDTDLLSQAPSELGLATPGASGIREHAGGALQAEGDYG